VFSSPACGGDALGQSGDGFDPLADLSDGLGEPVAVKAAIEPGAGGGPDTLAVTASLEPGWHLYSITQKPGGPLATTIRLAADSTRQLAGSFTADPAPTTRTIDEIPAWKGIPIEEHGGRVTWRAALQPGGGEVRGSVRHVLPAAADDRLRGRLRGRSRPGGFRTGSGLGTCGRVSRA